MLKKKKRSSVKTLVAKLDRIFSEYIRLRDSDNNGYCRCISCNSPHYWKDVDCGHFINRRHMGTRFDEKNCNGQCRSCNRFDEGNNIGYMRGIIKKYGEGVLIELEIKKHSVSKLSFFEYEVLITHYQKEVEVLKELKL